MTAYRRDFIRKETDILVSMTLLRSPQQRSEEQRNLARYMAYRLWAWVSQHPSESWKGLTTLTGINKGTISHLKDGHSSSAKIALKLAQTIGPQGVENFMALSEAWAKAYPRWKPGDALPSPLTHIASETEGRWAEMAQDLPERLMRAGYAVRLLDRDELRESLIQDAIAMAWSDNRENPARHGFTARDWLDEIDHQLKRLRVASGERESVGKIKSVPKV